MSHLQFEPSHRAIHSSLSNTTGAGGQQTQVQEEERCKEVAVKPKYRQ